MMNILKERWDTLVVVLSLVLIISYGFSDPLPFTRVASVLVPISLLMFYWVYKPEKADTNTAMNSALDDMVADFQAVLEEQEQVIKDYENIFDNQLVELPCVCGGNTFQGLFSPKTDNIVECEKCKNRYRVEISYNSVLISEPLDINQTFDNLVGEIN